MTDKIRLTQLTEASGWAAKIGPDALAQVLCHLPKTYDEKLLVGIDTSDDAAVYKIDDNTAIIQTIDFFTPIVDDPYMFGQIAATNSLSDVYAMGGKPILVMNVVCFPSCMDMRILTEILRGGADKVIEAGAVIAGGHTIDDKVPKYGLSVMGIVHPDKVLPNANSKAGDILILTKPLGTGIINAAIKGELANKKEIDEAITVMSTLNKYAADVAAKYHINACTDITGFGLLGHALEMAEGSNVSIHIISKNVEYISGTKDYAMMGIIPGGAYRNKKHVEKDLEILIDDEYLIDILADPQTSGGLLYSLPEKEGLKLLEDLKNSGVNAFTVGYVDEFKSKRLYIE